MKKEFQKTAKKVLATGVAAAALLFGAGAESQAQQFFSPSRGMPGLRNTAGYTCLPRQDMTRDFNRNIIDSQVEMDFGMLPAMQKMLNVAAMRGGRVCPDKSLRRMGLGLGETMLSPGSLSQEDIGLRAARNELLMAYELSNVWLSANGYSDQIVFQSLQENQQYHFMREASTWALTAGVLYDLKNMAGREDAWNMAMHTPYRDMFIAYEQAAMNDPSSEFRGISHLRAFQQWFAQPQHGTQVMEEINWRLHNGTQLPVAAALTPQFLMGLGRRPEPGRPNFLSEVQNSFSPYPDRDPTLRFSPLP